MNGTVVYRSRALGAWPWRIAWALLILFAVVPPWFVDADESLLYKLAMMPVYALTWGIWIPIVFLTLWSINRYGDITVTDQDLRVGREQFPLTDIAPLAVRNTLADLTGAAREPDREGKPATVHGPARHAGGAYAPTLGVAGVAVPMRNGQRLGVSARDPVGFLTALVSVVPER